MNQSLRFKLAADSLRDITKATDEVGRLRAAILGITALSGAGITGAFTAAYLIQTADKAKLLGNQIRTVTDDFAGYAAIQDKLFDVAQRTRSSLETTVQLYARNARAADKFGLSQEKLLTITETIQKAFAVGGATGLHGGANASRWHFVDPDRVTVKELGYFGKPRLSNGLPFSNKKGFAASVPSLTIASDAALGATIITVTADHFGHDIPFGSYIGFFPFHFGMYVVTEVIEPGRYRIWPQLRKAISVGDRVTLYPTLAMRPLSKDAVSIPRDGFVTEGATAQMVEVFDYDVREYFTE
jgi:hypothetical protein